MKVVIIGAGISGLTLAALLRRKAPDMEVALYEKDQGPFSRPQGYSIGLKDPAGLGVLTRLGLRPQLTGPRAAPVRQFIITNQGGKYSYRPAVLSRQAKPSTG